MSQHDLVIRGGTLVDGTGDAPRVGDLAIDGDRITAVGTDVGVGLREIDARGLLVTPGWVDIHAHYVMPRVSKTTGRDQSHITRSNHANIHKSPLFL